MSNFGACGYRIGRAVWGRPLSARNRTTRPGGHARRNFPPALLAWAGTVCAGRISVPINTAYKGEYLSHQLVDSGSRVLVVATSLFPAGCRHRRSRAQPGARDPGRGRNRRGRARPPTVLLMSKRLAALQCSGGTTCWPKACRRLPSTSHLPTSALSSTREAPPDFPKDAC